MNTFTADLGIGGNSSFDMDQKFDLCIFTRSKFCNYTCNPKNAMNFTNTNNKSFFDAYKGHGCEM